MTQIVVVPPTATPLGLGVFEILRTQGSRVAATLGFITQPLWGCPFVS